MRHFCGALMLVALQSIYALVLTRDHVLTKGELLIVECYISNSVIWLKIPVKSRLIDF